MKVIPGMCRAKLDSYVFIDFPLTFQYLYHGRTRWRLFQGCVVLN